MEKNDVLVKLLITLFRNNRQLVVHPEIYELSRAVIAFHNDPERLEANRFSDEGFWGSSYKWATSYFFWNPPSDEDEVR